jgi:hypothetical protein
MTTPYPERASSSADFLDYFDDSRATPTQVGHSYASTAGLYTSVSSDFKQKTVQQMIVRRVTILEDPDA